MSWQDDLRRLDAELAAGRIEPSAHRKQRDELLAQASGSTVPSPVPSPLRRPGSDAWHSANPANRPRQEPQTTQAPHAAHAAAQTPQQRSESSAPAVPYRPQRPSARPQPTPPWAITEKTLSSGSVPAIPDHMTTAPSPADINPTRYLRVDGPAADRPQATRFPPVEPTQVRKLPNGNPIGPPAVPPGKHRWEDGVEPEDPARGRRTWLFLSLGVLIVVGMIISATAWLSSDTSTSQATPTILPSLPGQPPAAAAQPQLELQVPPLPGLQSPDSSTVSLAKGLDLNLYPKETAQTFAQHGITQVVYRSSQAGDTGFLAIAAPAESANDAKAVVDYLREAAKAGGFVPLTADPNVVTGRNGDHRMDGTWYTSGKVAVVLWALLPFDQDKAGLKTSLDNALAVFQRALPPS